MTFSWIRPADPSVLAARPLLDLGTGDTQTLRTLAREGLVVGVDRSAVVLRAAADVRVAQADAVRLPFRDGAFATVLAADLFHHLDDADLVAVVDEAIRVLRPDGSLVAWWYERPGRPAPDAPRHPRPLDTVRALLPGRDVRPIELRTDLETVPTVGMVATVRA